MNNPSVGTASTLDELLSRLPSDPNLRGDAFEKVVKWFLQTDPAYTSELSDVWLWDEWPDRFGADIGIDLVAKTLEGDLWAVQAKGYDPENQVPTREIDSFISASSRPEFSHLLLVSTGLVSRNAEYKLNNQDKTTSLLLYPDLSRSTVNWLAFLDHSVSPLPIKKTRRAHQQIAIDDVMAGFASNDRGRLIMACGTGKTLTGLWLAEEHRSERTLVFVPTIGLVSQISKEWQANSGEPFRSLYVCSDKTVAAEFGYDAFLSKTSQLGSPVTTDPDKLKRFLEGPGRRVVFSTYQSSAVIKDAQDLGAPPFDLVIGDEAHHCVGKADSPFTTVLDGASIRAKKRIFMTATPNRLAANIRSRAINAGVDIIAMDDESKFGPEFHTLTFGQAIEDDLLSDYQLLIIGVTSEEVAHLTASRTLVELPDGNLTTDAHSLAGMIILLKAIREYSLSHILTFHNRINRATDLCPTITRLNHELPQDQSISNLRAQTISGEMRSIERDRILSTFSKSTGTVELLSNARCLGEGIDVPDIDAIAFLDPRRSQTDIAQAVGRAIRKGTNPDKIGTIVVPVLVDETAGEDPETQLDQSRFEPVWNVLKSLREHDEVLRQQLDELRFQLGRHGRIVGSLPGRIHIDMPEEVGSPFVDALVTRMVEMASNSWESWIGRLTAYNEEFGDVLVPDDFEAGSQFPLGSWIGVQRVHYKKNTLSQKRIYDLQNFPTWSWDPLEDEWNRMYSLVEVYLQGSSSNHVHRDAEVAGENVGGWVSKNINAYNQHRMPTHRIELMEKLPRWTWNPIRAEWDRMYGLLLQYVKEFGGSLVPAAYITVDGSKLGSWVMTQRHVAKRMGRREDDRGPLLERLPKWTWDQRQAVWEVKYQFVEEYVRTHNTVYCSKFELFPDGKGMYSWIMHQVDYYNAGTIDPEHIRLLELFQDWSWLGALDSYWKLMYRKLCRFFEENGHTQVPHASLTADGYKLGVWVASMRARKVHLSDERIDLLLKFPDWRWVSGSEVEDRWERNYELVKRNYEMEGNILLGTSSDLGKWLRRQRVSYKNNTLAQDRIDELNALGMIWDQGQAVWEEQYQFVEEYVRTHNTVHCTKCERFPDGKSMYDWIMNQIRHYNDGTMDPENIRRLELLQGWSWLGALDSYWQLMYRKLCRFFEENGHTQVQQASLTTDGYPLGSWVASMRGRKVHLSDERNDLLLKFPDWRWTSGTEAEDRWERNYELVKRNYEMEGNILLGTSSDLGKWLHRQRVSYKKNTLAQDRIDKLNQLGMVWDVRDLWWGAKFDALSAHKERTGDVNSRIRDNLRLREWREAQKSRYKMGKVSLERVEKLRSLGLNLG